MLKILIKIHCLALYLIGSFNLKPTVLYSAKRTLCVSLFSLFCFPLLGPNFAKHYVSLVVLSELTSNIFDHQLHYYKVEIIIPRRPVPNMVIILSPSDGLLPLSLSF